MAVSDKHQRYSKEIKLEVIRRVLEEDEAVQTVVMTSAFVIGTTFMSVSRNIKRIEKPPLIVL